MIGLEHSLGRRDLAASSDALSRVDLGIAVHRAVPAGHRMPVGAACLVLAFAASSAAALTPEALHCERADLSAAEAAYAGYSFTMTGEGFVIYDRSLIEGGRWEYILEHCPTRERLVVAVEGESEADIRQRFYDVTGPILAAIESDEAYTLQDLRRIAMEQGVETTLGIAGEQSCVCAAIGY